MDEGAGGDELDFDVRLGEPELGGSSLPEVIVESEVPRERDVRYFVSRATHIFRDRLGQTALEKSAKVCYIAHACAIFVTELNSMSIPCVS